MLKKESERYHCKPVDDDDDRLLYGILKSHNLLRFATHTIHTQGYPLFFTRLLAFGFL